MLRWLTPVLLAIMALPCWAAKRVSVAQLEQVLSTTNNTHRTDAETATQIGTLEPSERISNATLEKLTKLYTHGPQTSVALQLLADRSSFLELPAGELQPMPTPDAAAQQKLLEVSRRVAIESLPRIPNMLATRTTYSFDDSPRPVKKGRWPVKMGLHLVDITKAEVNVRNEQENIASGTLPAAHKPNGLMTWGEFGLALQMVLEDSAEGTTTWSHWEQFPGGRVAVFNYSVPKSASHYEIAVPTERVTHIQGSDRWLSATVRATGGTTLNDNGDKIRMTHETPGYRGSLWIDPATGTILRITLVAEVQGNSNLDRAATLVDYGSVQISGKPFVCPIRSLALSDAPADPATTINGGTTEWLNENLFTDYHLFATTSRILGKPTDAAGPTTASEKANGNSGAAAGLPPEAPAASSASTIQSTETASSLRPPSPPPSQANQQPSSPQTITTVSPQQSASVTPPPRTSSIEAPIESEGQPAPTYSGATVPPVPIVPPERLEPDSGLTLHVDVDSVLVPVVVRDEHGKSIDNLQKQDFAVFDDGKPRSLSGFLVEKHVPLRKTEQGVTPALASAPTTAAAQAEALPGRITVFAFDDLHLTAEQISYAQRAATETLDEALTGSDLAAVVTTSGKINSGLTRDRTILTGAITLVRPVLLYRPGTAQCPKLTYYQADLIANKHDGTAIADAVQQVTICNPVSGGNIKRDVSTSPNAMAGMTDQNGSDPIVQAAESTVQSAARQMLQIATQDLLTTYATIGEFAKKMARFPGQRTMILISPGFPPVDPDQREAESRLINLAAQSGVTINALNASGLIATGLQAEDNAKQIRNPVLTAEYREREMQNEENAIRELADGTGGTFFHDNNDLAAGFRAMLQAPETVYLLEVPLDGVKQNGTWHRLSVKSDRPGAHLQARQGYFAPSKNTKRK